MRTNAGRTKRASEPDADPRTSAESAAHAPGGNDDNHGDTAAVAAIATVAATRRRDGR
jgi:hypothetical protein